MHVISKMAQWERAGPITQRTVDQNYLSCYLDFFQLMSAQKTFVTQLIQTIRGTIFAIDLKFVNKNSTCHIITPQITRVIENPHQLISQFNNIKVVNKIQPVT